jgi:hypothetical protein
VTKVTSLISPLKSVASLPCFCLLDCFSCCVPLKPYFFCLSLRQAFGWQSTPSQPPCNVVSEFKHVTPAIGTLSDTLIWDLNREYGLSLADWVYRCNISCGRSGNRRGSSVTSFMDTQIHPLSQGGGWRQLERKSELGISPWQGLLNFSIRSYLWLSPSYSLRDWKY